MKQLKLFGSEEVAQIQPVEDLELTLAIEDALFRIRRDYERCAGRIYLSFSGGKDSTVLAHLIMMANLPTQIPFLFVNTGIELGVTVEFVQRFPYGNIQVLKPRKTFSQIIQRYGKPSLSKLKSGALATYRRNQETPFKKARSFQLINGNRIKDWKLLGGRNTYKLANKHMHFIHPDTEFKIDNRCCDYLKKYPFEDYEKEHDVRGAFSGVRTAEGGVRSISHKRCVEVKHKNGHEFIASMPIIDWSDELMTKFVSRYGIELSKAYTEYGLKRTGCIACPYGQNLKQELKVLYDFEPNRYQASMHWLKDVYMYQGVVCDFDSAYMSEYLKRKPLIEERRLSMIQKFRNPLKQRLMGLISGSYQKEKELAELDERYDILLMKQGEDQIYRTEFEANYAKLKPARKTLTYLNALIKQVKRELREEESSSWESELNTFPSFYQVILAAQGMGEVPKSEQSYIQQHPRRRLLQR